MRLCNIILERFQEGEGKKTTQNAIWIYYKLLVRSEEKETKTPPLGGFKGIKILFRVYQPDKKNHYNKESAFVEGVGLTQLWMPME